jgi:trigger factor
MQVSLETGAGLERKLTIQVPAETVQKEVETRLKSMTSRVRIDGFRPGKAPLKIVKQHYGSQVHMEVIGEVMQKSFRDAVTKESLKPAGAPSIAPKTMGEGQPLEYVATFEVYPEIKLADCSALQIERPKAEVKPADVDEMIETLRKQRTTFETVSRASQKDDQVTISFTGYVDGVAFEGGKADNVPVVIGSGSMIPGFEEHLIGKNANDSFSFDVTFPDNYRVASLKGKPAKFETRVISVAAPKLPVVDAEFAKAFGVADGNMDKLRADISDNMSRELRNRLSVMLKNNVVDALLKANDVQVPKALIDDECENLQKQMVQNVNLQAGMTLPKELFEGEAKRRVALGLLIGEIVRSAQIRVDPARVKAKIEDIAATYEDPAEVVNHYQKNRQLMSGIEALVLEEMVVDWVVSQAKAKDVEKSFAEVMKPAA